RVEYQRSEAAEAVALTMKDFGNRGFQTVVTAIAVDAGVVSETLCVIAETKLVVCLIKVPVRNEQLSLALAFKTTAGNDIENAVSAITVFCRITAALTLQIVDVFWIELRSDSIGDVRVRERHAVDQPSHLMPATNVQLIVGDI